jgi:hypothetical protein
MPPAKLHRSGNQKRVEMGTIIDFPADAASRRLGSSMHGAPCEDMGTVLILPVVRIEREPDETSGGSGPEEGAAPGRRRRRR